MILPTTELATILMLLLALFCLGSWQNALKLSGAWRYELFYYDFSLGVALSAIVAAYTFGSMNSSDLTFLDNFLIAGNRKMGYAVGAGAVFNLANLLLLAAITVTGMSIAFPMAVGFALVIGVTWSYIQNPQGSGLLLFGGVVVAFISIVINAFAYAERVSDQNALDKSPPKFDPRTKMVIKPPSPLKGIALSLGSGVLFALSYPLVEWSRAGDDGVGPYGIGLLFAGGLLFSTLLYNPFLMNFPVDGEAIHIRHFFKGSAKQHILGALGGIVCGAGVVATMIAASAPRRMQAPPGVTLLLGMGPAVLGALWGLGAWRDLKTAKARISGLVSLALTLFLAGLAIVGFVYGLSAA